MILLHSSSSIHRLQKQGYYRLCVLGFISFLTLASLAALVTKGAQHLATGDSASSSFSPWGHGSDMEKGQKIPQDIVHALLHYSTSNLTGGMTVREMRAIADVLVRRCPCNLLVFGLGHESLVWRALNHGGRTVFLDESEYWIAHIEKRHPGIEAYDVQYTTKVAQKEDLMRAAKEQVGGDCRPVQNLLFSECPLAINDLPNELYQVPWDVVLVDGPRGYSPLAPGRMSAIFTAAVLARSTKKGSHMPTHVFVHDFNRDVERAYSNHFLCPENMVVLPAGAEMLAHFTIHGTGDAAVSGFCRNNDSTTISSS
ncbi:hypothetical protein AMTR_s00051p00191940 [Amborella trichopoda]|uniref:Uncharacterized protein n=2 Tax=Amborella trichopoda TaxID=13333 RepID=U5D2M8_AMBTC|nr:hypothetical protein AMTR_s00051p00191940 [Amborella trichopoda]